MSDDVVGTEVDLCDTTFAGGMELYRKPNGTYVAKIAFPDLPTKIVDVPPQMAAMLPNAFHMLRNG
jgi:hypothetical protein